MSYETFSCTCGKTTEGTRCIHVSLVEQGFTDQDDPSLFRMGDMDGSQRRENPVYDPVSSNYPDLGIGRVHLFPPIDFTPHSKFAVKFIVQSPYHGRYGIVGGMERAGSLNYRCA